MSHENHISDPAPEAARRASAGCFDQAYPELSKADLIDAVREISAKRASTCSGWDLAVGKKA